MSQIQMRKRKASEAASSHKIQEKLGARDIECAMPVADRQWMGQARFRQAIPFSEKGLRAVNEAWDELLDDMLKMRYVGDRYTHEQGMILAGPIDSSDDRLYTEFALRVCAAIQQEAPRQSVGIVTASHTKYERLAKVYCVAYGADELKSGLGITWVSPSRLEEDFSATKLGDNGFDDACEASLALAPEYREGAPTRKDWEDARDRLVDDEEARGQVLEELQMLKERACEALFGGREVFDKNVPLPLARHPLLLAQAASNNFYSSRFDALVFLDAPRTFAEFVRWNCLCGSLRLVVGKDVGALGFMPYAQALAGLRVLSEQEFVLYGPLTDGVDTPCTVNTDALDRRAMMRHLRWGNALFFLYREPCAEWIGWDAVRRVAQSVFGKKKKKEKSTKRVPAHKLRRLAEKFPRVEDAGALLTVLCENMVTPSSADVRESFGRASAPDLQLRVQCEFAREQYYKMTSSFGHPDSWSELGRPAAGVASWRNAEDMLDVLSLRVTKETSLPMGVQHVLRKISENDGGRPILLLLPSFGNAEHSTAPFRLGLRYIVYLEVTKEMFDAPAVLNEKIRNKCEIEQPSCVLAYTSLALGCNPALTALMLREYGRQMPLTVLCQAGSLESVLMDMTMESIACRLDEASTLDPAAPSRARRNTFRRLCLAACRAFAIRVCADDLNSAFMPRSIVLGVMRTIAGDDARSSAGGDTMDSVLHSGDASRDDLLRSAALCGFEWDSDRPPSYDALAEYLQQVERRSCHESSPEVQADIRELPASPYAWTFGELAVASHRAADIERILQHTNMPERLTSGYMYRAEVTLMCAGRATRTPWFALPSSLTHALARMAVHRSAYHRRKETSKEDVPWWSDSPDDPDRHTWKALGNTVPRFDLTGEDMPDDVFMAHAEALREKAVRRAVTSVNEQAPWARGEERLKRMNEACSDWLVHAHSSLRLYHADFVQSEEQARRNARTFVRYDVERTRLNGIDMRVPLEEIADPHNPKSGRWFVRECVRKLKSAAAPAGEEDSSVEKVPHNLDMLLIQKERAIDLVSVLMPGPQRQAQIGRQIRVAAPDGSDRDLVAYENTLWFTAASLEHLSPTMEMLYNYDIVLQKDAARRIEGRQESVEERMAADTARALANCDMRREQPAQVRKRAAAHFQTMAAEATKAAERAARGETVQPTVTAEAMSLRSGRLQRPSDFMNLRFLQTTGAIFGREKMREVLERTMGSASSAEEAIRMLYARHRTTDDFTFFTLADNVQRASYFERAKLTMVFRIMLNSVLDTGRPRLAPEFTGHTMPMLKSGMLLGVTAKTRKLIGRTLDDLVSDLDACHYLSLPPEEQTAPDDPRYGDPERDPAFSARTRRMALLCPRFVRVLIRRSIDRAAKRVRPALEAHQAQLLAFRSRADNAKL